MRLRAVKPLAPPGSGPPAAEPPGARDDELVARARQGDRNAREAIFRRHVDSVATTALRLLGDSVEADDVVQETFLDAFEQLGRLKAPSALRSWLLGIAVHKVHRRFRRRRLLRWLGLDRGSEPALLRVRAAAGSSPEVHLELRRLAAVLEALPDLDRAAWVLRRVEGHPLAEVAALCRCGLTTAKRRIARAEAVVRKHVQIEEVEDGSS